MKGKSLAMLFQKGASSAELFSPSKGESLVRASGLLSGRGCPTFTHRAGSARL